METPSVVYYEHSFNDSEVKSLAKSVLNLGNECRALAEENKRLKSLCDNLGMGGKYTITAIEAENARLQAQVERLTKAGDAMQTRLNFFQKRWDSDEMCEEAEAWNAAKEGEQSK
jgi:hypothetical protein